jgi:hypothetical protein
MSRLFIELYLDEDVDVLLAQLMRARGAVRRPPREMARRLLRLLNSVTAEEMQNHVRYI